MRNKIRGQNGYTLIELMMVVAIMGFLASIIVPRFSVLIAKAEQSKTKSNLGTIRTALSIYYSDSAGAWPLSSYPEGDVHYTSDGVSLSTCLVPKYLEKVPTPKVSDHMVAFNGIDGVFDSEAQRLMEMDPPKDVFIIWGAADYTPMLDSPYGYDNQTGSIYITNGNYDYFGNYYYSW